jgi:hypothetical protein
MRHLSSKLFILVASCALLIASAGPTLARESSRSYYAAPGVVMMKFSPELGINVGIAIEIDGRVAGAITKGHVFRTALAPGPHRITVYRSGRLNDAFEDTLHVRPGETYAFVIKYRVNEIMLKRVTRFR